MFNREMLREMGANVIAELGHASSLKRHGRQRDARRPTGKAGGGERLEKAAGGRKASGASTPSTTDIHDDLSTCANSVADSGESRDYTGDSDRDTSTLTPWAVASPPYVAPQPWQPQPWQPELVGGPAAWAPTGVMPAGERRSPWENAWAASSVGPAAMWPACADFTGTPPEMSYPNWAPLSAPAWVPAAPVHAQERKTEDGPHEPTGGPAYIRVPRLERACAEALPRGPR